MKRIIIGLLLLTGLSGCHIYRTYERPELSGVDSLYRVPAMTEDTMSLADFSWKELFTDTVLQQLIEKGIANNTDLNIARLKVREAEALLTSSKLAYLPSVSLTPQGTIKSIEGNSPTKTYNLAASADWELDIFGRLTNAKREAKAVLEQSQAYKQAVQTQLIATIANSYYTLLMLDKQLDISKRTAEIWAENLRVMKALKKAGQTTEMAVAQIEASKLSVECFFIVIRTANYRGGKFFIVFIGSSSSEDRSFDIGYAVLSRYFIGRSTFAVVAEASRRTPKRSCISRSFLYDKSGLFGFLSCHYAKWFGGVDECSRSYYF